MHPVSPFSLENLFQVTTFGILNFFLVVVVMHMPLCSVDAIAIGFLCIIVFASKSVFAFLLVVVCVC